jgi:hypothetical protein
MLSNPNYFGQDASKNTTLSCLRDNPAFSLSPREAGREPEKGLCHSNGQARKTLIISPDFGRLTRCRPADTWKPAFADRRIYARNDHEIICVDLSKK